MLLEPSLDLTSSKSKINITVRTSNCMYCKKKYCDCMYHGNREMHMMAAIAIGSDHILIGIIVKLIAISSDCASMDVNGGFDGGFDGWFHLAVLGYSPQQSV